MKSLLFKYGRRKNGSSSISSMATMYRSSHQHHHHSYNNNKPSSSSSSFSSSSSLFISSLKKNRYCRRLIVLFILYVFIQTFVFLKTWFPGDPTLRRISESSLKLMFSRSGFSFGTSRVFSKRYSSLKGGEGEDGGGDPKETRQTKKQYVVQGQIPDRPTWGEDFDIHKYVKDVRLGEKGRRRRRRRAISNCSVSLPWTRTNRK